MCKQVIVYFMHQKLEKKRHAVHWNLIDQGDLGTQRTSYETYILVLFMLENRFALGDKMMH